MNGNCLYIFYGVIFLGYIFLILFSSGCALNYVNRRCQNYCKTSTCKSDMKYVYKQKKISGDIFYICRCDRGCFSVIDLEEEKIKWK